MQQYYYYDKLFYITIEILLEVTEININFK